MNIFTVESKPGERSDWGGGRGGVRNPPFADSSLHYIASSPLSCLHRSQERCWPAIIFSPIRVVAATPHQS